MQSDNNNIDEIIEELIAEIQDRKAEQYIFMTRQSVILSALETYRDALPPSKARVFIAQDI